jgi:F0F1-type ATP synthase gamma subunit
MVTVTVREYREFILMEMDDVDDIIVMNDGKVLSLDDIMAYGCTVNLLTSQPPNKIIRPLDVDGETESENENENENESENELEDESTELEDYLLPEYIECRKWEF